MYQVHKHILDVIETRNYELIDEAITDSVDTWSVLQNLQDK